MASYRNTGSCTRMSTIFLALGDHYPLHDDSNILAQHKEDIPFTKEGKTFRLSWDI